MIWFSPRWKSQLSTGRREKLRGGSGGKSKAKLWSVHAHVGERAAEVRVEELCACPTRDCAACTAACACWIRGWLETARFRACSTVRGAEAACSCAKPPRGSHQERHGNHERERAPTAMYRLAHCATSMPSCRSPTLVIAVVSPAERPERICTSEPLRIPNDTGRFSALPSVMT